MVTFLPFGGWGFEDGLLANALDAVDGAGQVHVWDEFCQQVPGVPGTQGGEDEEHCLQGASSRGAHFPGAARALLTLGRSSGQIPEIKQTLEILKYMQKKKESTSSLETRFLLADNLYCKASVPPTDKVCLWLGANVMLEYDIDEAQALLEKNLLTATKNLDSLEEDLDFLRDQFTTTEVNMARVYNWDVKRRNKDDSTKNKA